MRNLKKSKRSPTQTSGDSTNGATALEALRRIRPLSIPCIIGIRMPSIRSPAILPEAARIFWRKRRRAKAAASDSDVEWLSWSSSSADAFMEGLASRDPVAARALAGEMRRVAETRGDSLLWEYWARASFYLIEAFGQAQDPSEAQQGLVDLRRIAEARNEDIIWRWWAKASFSLIVDLGARRDGAAAQALLDAAKLLNVLTEFGDMSAKQSLVPTVVSGTEPPPPEQMAAAKIVWDALKPIEEARHECRDWEQWAKHALARDEEYKIAPRDLAAAQALLNDLHGVAGVAQRRRSFQPLRPSFLRFGGPAPVHRAIRLRRKSFWRFGGIWPKQPANRNCGYIGPQWR